MNRRNFIQAAGAGFLAQAAATPQASGRLGAGIRLGFDTYSLRAFKWKDLQLLDFAASLGVDTVQISDSADYASLEPAHLARVKAHAASLNLELDAGIGCICPLAKGWKDRGRSPSKKSRRASVSPKPSARAPCAALWEASMIAAMAALSKN